MLSSIFFKKYLMPGFIFQSVVIGGGYGTGRELVEFFMSNGPLAGILGMLVATTIWSTVLAISFDIARRDQLFNYRSFINSLLGKGWVIYEIVYVIGLVMVVAVMGSAAGEILNQMIGIPQNVGIALMITIVGFLTFFGTDMIEKVLSIWSLVLYVVFVIVVALSLFVYSSDIAEIIGSYDADANWAFDGARYAAYNVGIMPAMLFALRHLETRNEALISGAVAGVVAMLPGVMIYVAMLAAYPGVLTEPIPVIALISSFDTPVVLMAFQIVLFGTFVETGVGLVHGFNERIATTYADHGRELPAAMRGGIAVVLLLISIYVADAVGLVKIIADGYGMLTWGYWFVFVIPVVTIGLWRVIRKEK